ncbi:stress enhanced protein 1, chloroplastic isoform X1 [Rhodamnia argentea]|uniref:Stress enhanced protein 1, chloroplastic isoform X1 n=1 Tax=Rhodamnia argentea TaxID=178133 RepID=A0A8B8QA44_9MYRT|nr:stress enhanced protein 1, chloroplastic isoform X1 [Rhodamnia argentea]
MAAAQVSTSLSVSVRGFCAISSPRTSIVPRVRLPDRATSGATFATGSPLAVKRPSSSRKSASKAAAVSIRCKQNTGEGNSLDVWLGRLAMVGFAAAISVEIGTGKGLLENFGLTAPLPTVALAVTALVGVLTAIFIFQSASSK